MAIMLHDRLLSHHAASSSGERQWVEYGPLCMILDPCEMLTRELDPQAGVCGRRRVAWIAVSRRHVV